MFRRRSTALKVALGATAGIVIAAVLTVLLMDPGRSAATGRRPAVAAAPSTAPTSTTFPAPQPAGPPPTLIATLSVATPYSAAPGGPSVGRLDAQNPFGAPQVLAVTGTQGEGPSAWLHVELPIRPNGSTGWIPAAGVSLTQTDYRVAVSRANRSLTVTKAGLVVLTTPVAVGKASTPTPPGSTYLWELVRPDDPKGPYGPYIFGLAEYSDAYAVFNGGDAQIGMHGQDEPWSIGFAVSNGCIRLPNDVIVKLAGMLPLGTPVTITQ